MSELITSPARPKFVAAVHGKVLELDNVDIQDSAGRITTLQEQLGRVSVVTPYRAPALFLRGLEIR